MFSFSGKKVLITGATRGIGRATAELFLKQGASVILTGTKQETLDALKNDLALNYDEQCFNVVQLDLSMSDQVDSFYADVEERFGHIDILVNNAGITRDALILRMKDSDWDDVLNVNLRSVFKLCKAATSSMMKKRFGRIINITSVVAVSGNVGQTNYCAAKSGLIGFSKALAKEVALRNITVNCIAPGFIKTDMSAKIPEKIQETLLNTIPAKTMGTPNDIASAILFSASDEARYMTGQTLHINGGLEMV